MIDNYDSFTYNLVQCLGVLGADLVVYRNDHIIPGDIDRLRPDGIVISPGPKRPEDAGMSKQVIVDYAPRVKLLGVCLGHQCIAESFGGGVRRAEAVMHGKTSPVFHDGKALFAGIESPFEAARYHSLVVDEDSLPGCLEVTGKTQEGVVMGIRHREYPVEGIQFHPESFMTESGMTLLENFLES